MIREFLGKNRVVGLGNAGAFSIAKLTKNWSVFPLIGIMTVALSGAVGFMIYAALTKSDVK